MTENNAVFEGTVAGFKTVGSRKVVCITVEAPIENIADIARIAEHGAWVAVARLRAPEAQEKAKKRWHEMLPSAQMAIRVGEPMFRAFLLEERGLPPTSNVEQFLKTILGITSKKELNSACGAQELWFEMDSEFQAWQHV